MPSETEILELISACTKTNDIKREIKEYMREKIHFYPQDWTLFQMAHHELYREKSKEILLCPVCKKQPLKFNGLKSGYAKNCSESCRSRNPQTHEIYKKTCLVRYGVEYASQATGFKETVKQTSLNKYGVENAFQNTELKLKHKKTIMEKYGVPNVSQSPVIINKIRRTHENTGLWTPLEKLSELQKYRALVKSISAKSYHDHYYKINPQNLPRSRYEYHLDHIYSVEEGFKNNVPPEVIGHYTNLRMLWHLDNSRKNTKCHITVNQLMERYHTAIQT